MKCEDCKYKKINCGTSLYARRYNVFCKHPNQDYINNYCNKHRVVSMPGFICFTKKDSVELTTKTAPRWCPLKKEEQK